MANINALVESGTFNFGLHRGRNRVVFQNPRGNKYYYCFYCNQNSDLVYEYSTNGTIWSGSVYTIETGGISDYDVKFNDNGSSLDIFIVFYDAVDSDLMYIYGNITDAGSIISFDTKQAIDADINTEINATMSVAIARTDNGRLVVAFTEDYNTMGKDYRQTNIIGSDGDGASPSWSNETMIDDPSGDTNNQDKIVYVGMESFSSSYPNRVLIYGKIPDATTSVSYQVKVWVYDWNGSSMSSIDSDSPVFGAYAVTGDNLSAIIDDDDRVHIIAWIVQTATLYFDHWKYPTAGGLGTETKYDITEAIIDACTLTLDRTNDELYVFYHHSADTTTFHYKKTPVGTISWGSEQDITSSDTITQLSSWNSDVEDFLHLAYVDDDGDVYYYGFDLISEITVYKDVTLKTTLESALTYKDITLKTTLDAQDYKDITLKTSLSEAPILVYKDITLKTTLESALTYKDITLKITLDSLDYKDITLKTSLHSLDYKDITLKTTLESALTYKDVSIKTSFTAPATYKDVALKTTLESALTYKDITLKTTLDSLDYKDITLKTTIDSLDYKDITLKTTLESALTYKDITLKTTLESVLTYKDMALKTTLDSLDYKDVAIKTSFESDITTAYKDIALKTTLESALTYKDIALKITLDSLDYKDMALKITLDSLDYKDIALKTTIESTLTYKDIALKITLDSLDYKDIALKTTIESALTYKDIAIKTSLESVGENIAYKDITLKTTLDSLDYKDMALKTTLESALIYKDIALKITLDSLDYKDIALKISLDSASTYKDIALKTTLDALDYKDISIKISIVGMIYKDISIKISLEAIPKEIINLISSINQTKDLVSSITQIEDLVSVITQTENFIANINL